MPEFLKYVHLERVGTNEVDGIEIGLTYVFPKLDGTNGQIWRDENGQIQAGSRNRVLSADADNAGFFAWVQDQENIRLYLDAHPHHTLYGEWLVPHSLKTYRDDAWRRFYVFDVLDQTTGAFKHYENYKDGLDAFGVEYLAPIAQVRNGSTDHYLKCLDKNTYLIRDGDGVGEGVVIKNYNWQNKFGRVTWAKLITNEFREKHAKAMGVAEIGGKILEEKIVDEFVSNHLVKKNHAKIATENDGWQSKFIGQLLGRVWHDLITEEMFEILKRHKNPKIDFAAMVRLCNARVKSIMPELF